MGKNPQSGVRHSHRQATSTTGLCAGTKVMTTDGAIPVEHLTAGDRLVTRDGTVPLHGTVARRETVFPIQISASSLGHNLPAQDTVVTMSTCIHLRNWRARVLYGVPYANIAAGRMVDGKHLQVLPARDMTVYDLKMDQDQIIYADGVEMLAQAA